MLCVDFYDLSVWCGCWFVVYIRRFIYKFLNVCPFDYTAVAGSGKVARKPVYHTSLVAVVTQTDRPKSVRNWSLIELFVALFVLLLCPFDISVGIGAFVIGLGQISSFLSLHLMFHRCSIWYFVGGTAMVHYDLSCYFYVSSSLLTILSGATIICPCSLAKIICLFTHKGVH